MPITLSQVEFDLLIKYPNLREVPLQNPNDFKIVNHYWNTKKARKEAAHNWVEKFDSSFRIQVPELVRSTIPPRSLPILITTEEAHILPLTSQEKPFDEAIRDLDTKLRDLENQWKALRIQLPETMPRPRHQPSAGS